VIGAGPIGCELAQAFARFGSEVTLIGKQPQLLPREDRDAADILEKSCFATASSYCWRRNPPRGAADGESILRLDGGRDVRADAILVGSDALRMWKGLAWKRPASNTAGTQG